MIFYYLRSDGAYCCDQGQTQDQITAKCAPLTVTFISEEEYTAAIAAITAARQGE